MESWEDGFPKGIATRDGLEARLSLMVAVDIDDVRDFAVDVPEQDRVFLERDIRTRAEIEAWVADIEKGANVTLLARVDQAVVGYVSLLRSRVPWSSHVVELRLVVAEPYRRKHLGDALLREGCEVASALGAEKLSARMLTDQTSAIQLFLNNGFETEAVLVGEVKGNNHQKRDVLLMVRFSEAG